MTLARSGLFAVAVSLLAVACGGRSIGDDLTGTPSPPDAATPVSPDAGPDAPTQCNGPNLACDPGDELVPSEAACGKADYCYSRTGCPGSQIWCAHRNGPQCGAIPRCDNGDMQVQACPDGGPNSGLTCYPRTLCGSTIQCVHHEVTCTALPSCQPGDIEVTSISTCSMKGVSCYAVTECNYTIHCYTP
jgi:hypothetical protein